MKFLLIEIGEEEKALRLANTRLVCLITQSSRLIPDLYIIGDLLSTDLLEDWLKMATGYSETET